MQFHLNDMVCLLCTSVPPNSCSGADNHKGFFWISIKQMHLSKGEPLWLCQRLSVQLVFSIKDKREILFCNCFWCCNHRPPLAFKLLIGDVELGIWFLKCESLPWKWLHDRPHVRALKAFLRIYGWCGIKCHLDDPAQRNSSNIPVCISTDSICLFLLHPSWACTVCQSTLDRFWVKKVKEMEEPVLQ